MFNIQFIVIIMFYHSKQLDVNMAVKDTIGGWKDNAFLYKSPNACKSLKHFLGSAWIPIMTGFGMINAKCPIPTVIKRHLS